MIGPFPTYFLAGDSYPQDEWVEAALCARLPNLRAQAACFEPMGWPTVLAERLEHVASRLDPSPNVVLIGRSSGGRLATILALQRRLRAVVCLGYPFQNPDLVLEYGRFAHLARLSVPTLILQGADDVYGGADLTERYQLSSVVQVRVLAGVGHEPHLSPAGWDQVATLITTFLAGPGFSPASEMAVFDEADYLRRHPDVAAAVAEGRLSSGYAHFVSAGRAAKRRYRIYPTIVAVG